MASIKDVPAFGMLEGLKVLSTGSVIAGPWAAGAFAENGATVIHAESTAGKDTLRGIKYCWEQEHRNELVIALNTPSDEGKEIFLKMCEWADIWIESSKGGTYEKWGLSDEVIWERNPKLVCVHVSGYGETGDPGFVNRASYDAAGQCMGGYAFVNGFPDPMPPMKAVPYTCDYTTTLNVAWMSLAAYICAQRTGKGESIDLAQFEVMTKLMAHYPATAAMDGVALGRSGNDDPTFAGYSLYPCGDGNYVFVGAVGKNPLKKLVYKIGLQDHEEYFDDMQMATRALYPKFAVDLDEAIKAYCADKTSLEVDAIFAEEGVPSAPVMTLVQALDHPHYIARGVWAEWDDPTYGTMKGVNAYPVNAKNNPAQIWRGAPLYGADTRDVLADFGYSEADIDGLFERGIVK
jgi:crotonobetainyl-CoA:carnitine CoA-transferase CaiB-like acyl-CoA transferase